MGLFQLGFVQASGGTPRSGNTFTCVHNIPGGKYHCRLFRFHREYTSSTNYSTVNMIGRGFRVKSNEFYIHDTIGNASQTIGNDWLFGFNDEGNRIWGDLNFQVVLSGQPITLEIIEVTFGGGTIANHLSFVLDMDLTPLDGFTPIERPLLLPNIAKLMILAPTTTYTSQRTINIPVNAFGRYKCRVLGLIFDFTPGASISYSVSQQLLIMKSTALNNFGYQGGSGFLFETKTLDTSVMPHQKPCEFLSNTIANSIDITMVPITNIATNDIVYLMMYLEMIPVIE